MHFDLKPTAFVWFGLFGISNFGWKLNSLILQLNFHFLSLQSTHCTRWMDAEGENVLDVSAVRSTCTELECFQSSFDTSFEHKIYKQIEHIARTIATKCRLYQFTTHTHRTVCNLCPYSDTHINPFIFCIAHIAQINWKMLIEVLSLDLT